jgi:hypothetical protein
MKFTPQTTDHKPARGHGLAYKVNCAHGAPPDNALYAAHAKKADVSGVEWLL